MKRVALPWLALAAVAVLVIGLLVFSEGRANRDPVLQLSYDPGFSDHRLRHKIEIFPDGHAELHHYPPGTKEMEVVVLMPRDPAEVAKWCEALANGPKVPGSYPVDLPYMSLSARKRGSRSSRQLTFGVMGSSKPFDWVERTATEVETPLGKFLDLTPSQLEAIGGLRELLWQYSL